MRVELHAERAQLSFGKLRDEARSLRLALASLGEIEERMLNADQREIDAHAERKGCKNPTHEAQPDRAFSGACGRRKDSEPQQRAKGGPCHAHAKRAQHMQRNIARQMRALQRKPAAGAKYQWREQRVEQPVDRTEKYPVPVRRTAIQTALNVVCQIRKAAPARATPRR